MKCTPRSDKPFGPLTVGADLPTGRESRLETHGLREYRGQLATSGRQTSPNLEDREVPRPPSPGCASSAPSDQDAPRLATTPGDLRRRARRSRIDGGTRLASRGRTMTGVGRGTPAQ